MFFGYLLGLNENFRKFLRIRTATTWFVITIISFIVGGMILQFAGFRGEAMLSVSSELMKAIIMAVFYLANVLLLMLSPLLLFLKFHKLRIWSPLVAAGRMTLTHYLVQNLLFSFIFYGYGLGWYSQISPLQLWSGYAFLVFIQIMLSCWWLKTFGQGPVEKLLRRFAYA
jgi:uncharacterized protein